MVKDLKEFSEKANERMVLFGISYAMYDANLDKENYLRYKKDDYKDMKESTFKSCLVLYLLENLGYPMDELGTYLYKDVIVEVMDRLKSISISDDIKENDLLEQLNNMYSQFYLDIARNDKEMGLKSFHLYINEAVSKIDQNKINQNLVKRIYKLNEQELNYGIQAFQFASYILNFYSYDVAKEVEQPKIIKLPNMPSDIRLKETAVF